MTTEHTHTVWARSRYTTLTEVVAGNRRPWVRIGEATTCADVHAVLGDLTDRTHEFTVTTIGTEPVDTTVDATARAAAITTTSGVDAGEIPDVWDRLMGARS